MAFRLAHLSDLHILALDGVEWWRFANKRLSGLANLRAQRGRHHDPRLVERLLGGLDAAKADHLVVTGDLTNLALESEFEAVRRMFERHGIAPREASVIPGNHDAYTRGAHRARRFEAYFAEYASSDDDVSGSRGDTSAFPFLRRRGPLALYGLSSAVPRPLLVSSGVIGEGQRGRLRELVAQAPATTPVLLAHHPVVNVRSRLRRTLRGLDDADALVDDFQEHAHAVALHGHLHARMWRRAKTNRGFVEVLGATSASLEHADDARMAGMNLYDFDAAGRLIDAHALVVVGDTLERRSIPVVA